MDLKLYDTLAREKRVFTPLDPSRVGMYVCGPTVYDFAHIGNARPAIVFDVLFRLLRHLYGAEHVTYVRNITDVDDKINARAAQEYPSLPLNEAISEVTKKTEKQYHEDVDALGCLRPTVEPRATEHIGEMRELIERLVASGYAYVASGHVLFSVRMPFARNYLVRGNAYVGTEQVSFSVPTMNGYGSLSNRSLDEMIAGSRVEVAPYKRDPMDFVLWKPSKPGEPAWPSPAGIATPGRPGWHIECSAMSWKHLGKTFDIHGGGIDLVFPHHENEIAQSRCSFDTKVMANYWMHNGFLQVEGEKMSKSLGNFVTIRELLKDWPGDVIRLTMLKTHYRQPINWTIKSLEEAERTLSKWAAQLRSDGHEAYGLALPDGSGYGDPFGAGDGSGYGGGNANLRTFIEALGDDLNTPLALAILHQVDNPAEFHEALNLLGVDLNAFQKRTKSFAASVDILRVDSLIDARNAARKAKDFKEADRIRDELAAMGVVIKDSKDGTAWEVKR
jgi:cysteinyl-tRNA synthetase